MLELARLAAAAKVEAERVAVANQPDPDAPPALPPRNEEEAASRVAKQAAKDTAVKEAADKAEAAKVLVEQAVAAQKAKEEEDDRLLDPIPVRIRGACFHPGPSREQHPYHPCQLFLLARVFLLTCAQQ